MRSYDWAHAIETLYDQWRHQPEVSTDFEMRKIAMHFCLVLREENFGYEKDGNTHHPEWERSSFNCLHFLITSRHQVFMAVAHKADLMSVPLEAWENTSNHDSCWRSDGVQSRVTDLMFKMWDECWSHVPAEHQRLPKTANISVRLETRFLGGTAFDFARVEHEPVNLSDSYWRKLTKITPLKPVIGFKELDQ